MSNGPGINVQSAQALVTSNTTLPEFNMNVSVVDDNVFPRQSSTLIIRDAIVTHNRSASQDDLNDQNLDLHNSFDILGSEAENATGEALLGDPDTLEVSVGLQDAARNSPKVVSDEVVSLVNDTSLEAPCNRSLELVANLIEKHVEQIAGRPSFPTNSSPSSMQDKVITPHEDPALVQALPYELLGASVIPASSVRVVNSDRLKALVDTPVLTLMPQPITTSYASLTTDKLPSSQILIPASKSSFHSAAAFKSVKILSKFWGDEVEEVMEDTLSHDLRLEMEDFPSLSESTNAERKKKTHVNKVKPSSFNSAGMRTCAQKGTSKAALTDTK